MCLPIRPSTNSYHDCDPYLVHDLPLRGNPHLSGVSATVDDRAKIAAYFCFVSQCAYMVNTYLHNSTQLTKTAGILSEMYIHIVEFIIWISKYYNEKKCFLISIPY